MNEAGNLSIICIHIPFTGVFGIEAPKVRFIAAQGNALGMWGEKPKALKGRLNSWDALSPSWADSIPHKPFIELNFVFREKRSELFLKRLHAMVLILIANVVSHLWDIGFAHRERSVSRLPRKAFQRRSVRLDPFGR